VAVDDDALAQLLVSQWSQQHDGYDADRSRMVRAWLRAMHALAAPLARRGIPPTALTLAGIGSAGAAVTVAADGAPSPAAATLVLATAVFDGLDGAVALQRRAFGRPLSRHGAAIDHAADRVTDVLFAAALAAAGATRRSAVAAAVATIGYETVRAWLRRSGRVDAVVTVGERPIRVVVVCAGLVGAPSLAAAGVAVLASGGSVQLLATRMVALSGLTRVGSRGRNSVTSTRGTDDGSQHKEDDDASPA
jgi:phosphatidylglycerophosphate synthase